MLNDVGVEGKMLDLEQQQFQSVAIFQMLKIGSRHKSCTFKFNFSSNPAQSWSIVSHFKIDGYILLRSGNLII
jgi:hypothetical protein